MGMCGNENHIILLLPHGSTGDTSAHIYHHSRSRLQFSIGRHQTTADVDRSMTDLQCLSQY